MNIAIIVAGGNGTRMKLDGKKSKQFISLCGIPALVRTMLSFSLVEDIDKIIVVTRECDIKSVRNLVNEYSIKKVESIIKGGSTRQKSVLCGLEETRSVVGDFEKFDCKILIHDGARPFVSRECISSVLDALDTTDAAAAGVAVKDTIKLKTEDGYIERTLPRDRLISIQTPQGFRASLIYAAHQKAVTEKIEATDDCMLVELLSDKPVKITMGDYNNIKITTPEDIALGESILKKLNYKM